MNVLGLQAEVKSSCFPYTRECNEGNIIFSVNLIQMLTRFKSNEISHSSIGPA